MLKFRSKNVISTQPRAHFQLSEDPEFPFVTPQSPIKSAYILETKLSLEVGHGKTPIFTFNEYTQSSHFYVI